MFAYTPSVSVSEVSRQTVIAADPARITSVADEAIGLRIGFERPWKATEQMSRGRIVSKDRMIGLDLEKGPATLRAVAEY